MEPECSLPHSQLSATRPLSWASPIQSTCPQPISWRCILILSTPRSPQRSLSLRFPHQDPIRPPLLIDTSHMPSPSHSSRFYHPHNNLMYYLHYLHWFIIYWLLIFSIVSLGWRIQYESFYLLPWWIVVLGSWCMSVKYEMEPRRNWGSFCNSKCNLACLEYLERNHHVISRHTVQNIIYKTTLYLFNSFIVALEFTGDLWR
jgi:hypothetical protein